MKNYILDINCNGKDMERLKKDCLLLSFWINKTPAQALVVLLMFDSRSLEFYLKMIEVEKDTENLLVSSKKANYLMKSSTKFKTCLSFRDYMLHGKTFGKENVQRGLFPGK